MRKADESVWNLAWHDVVCEAVVGQKDCQQKKKGETQERGEEKKIQKRDAENTEKAG